MKLKKGSAAAKAWGRKMQAARNKSRSPSIKRKSTIKYTGVKKVAKRRRTRRRSYAAPKRRKSYKSKSMFGLGSLMLGAIAYGALRAKMSNALAPLTAKIPLGNISDEVGMIIALSLAKKFMGRKVPLVSQVATAGTYIELARIGEELISGGFNFGNKSVDYNYFN